MDHSWLKYALLYIDKLRPIIPYDAMRYINDTTRKLINESDLISPYYPEYKTALRASRIAVDYLNHIFKHPDDYVPILGKNFIGRWRLKDNQTNVLFREKYTDSFFRFCIDNKIGYENDNGLNTSRNILDLYMILFANCASELEGLGSVLEF